MAFARLVTHYVRHNTWLDDGALLREAGALAGIPGVMVNGRFDFQAPIGNAWELSRVWPQAELTIAGNAGHAANEAIALELVRAGPLWVTLMSRRRGESAWTAFQAGSQSMREVNHSTKAALPQPRGCFPASRSGRE